MDQESPTVVRGRCACGRRYRIRNARPGVTVACPNCRRLIPITLTDLRQAASDENLIPIQVESETLLEAVPVNQGALRLAPKGSRPGLTGAKVLSHEEAVLANLQIRNPSLIRTYESLNPSTDGRPLVWAEFEPGSRAFLHDLLASFYFAGVPRNAVNVLTAAAGCSLLLLGVYLVKIAPVLLVFFVPLCLFVLVYMVQFFWNVLKMTANDEDLIPWSQDDWSLWHDGVKPMLWMGGISALCTLPYYLLITYAAPRIALDPIIPRAVLVICWFFWPIAVMSAALGNTILFVRPDWLVRCVVGVGPVYLLAWAAVMLAAGGGYFFWLYWQTWIWIPIVGVAVNLYFGYVVFRTFGLLFRHFRNRFPWKY